jgi:hypothetical protein
MKPQVGRPNAAWRKMRAPQIHGRLAAMSDSAGDRELYETAYHALLQELPEPVARALSRLRAPGMRWVRVGFGVLFMAGGALSFLPVLGIELLPLGVLLLAQDMPPLHRPVGVATLWFVERVRAIKACLRPYAPVAQA